MAIDDGMFAIDNGITYQYNRLFITTAPRGCASFEARIQVNQCQSEVGMSGGRAAAKIE